MGAVAAAAGLVSVSDALHGVDTWLHSTVGDHIDEGYMILVTTALSATVVAWRRSALARRESALRRESEEVYRSIVETAREWIWQTDRDGRIIYSNPAVRDILGYDADEVVGRTVFDLMHPGDAGRARARLADPEANRRGWERAVSRFRHRDGGWRSLESGAVPVLDAAGALAGYRGVDQDITERRALEDRLVHDALHDALTGLANRTLLVDRVEHALARSARSGERHGVVFVDVDDFKTVNDSLGHAAGDALLVALAQRLRGAVRADDTPARLGGDEFAVFLEGINTAAEVDRAAGRIVAALRSPLTVEGREVFVRWSVGCAVSRPGMDAAELLGNADLAMYAAKREGKGRSRRYTAELRSGSLERLILKGELEQALDNDEFVLHYQPVVDLAGDRVVGLEALIRWRHPSRGLLSPADFLPLAEETGLITGLGRWVAVEACRRFAGWRATLDPALCPSRVAVNVSATRFADPELLEEVAGAVADAGLPGEALVLEITESALVVDPHATRRHLEALRDLGMWIALDDFGTGYSSLGYLRDFPLNILKIDATFTAGVDGGAEASALARAIIKLGQTLGLDVVAEGITSAPQVHALRRLRCGFGQGYHFSPPLPPEAVPGFLTARAATQPLSRSASAAGRG